MDNLTDETPATTDGKVTLQELYKRCEEQEKIIDDGKIHITAVGPKINFDFCLL